MSEGIGKRGRLSVPIGWQQVDVSCGFHHGGFILLSYWSERNRLICIFPNGMSFYTF